MSFVVIAYPKISQTNFDWIEIIRQEYDLLRYSVVKPHITFVFPSNKIDQAMLIQHVQAVANRFKAIPIKLDLAKVVEDDSKTYSHAFLVPSLGYDQITQLHDLLYTGALKSELRLDIPFIPHLGIGNNPDKTAMQTLVDKINNGKVSIYGTIDELTVAEHDASNLVDIIKVALH